MAALSNYRYALFVFDALVLQNPHSPRRDPLPLPCGLSQLAGLPGRFAWDVLGGPLLAPTYFVLGLFPTQLAPGGSFTNVHAHGIGFALRFVYSVSSYG